MKVLIDYSRYVSLRLTKSLCFIGYFFVPSYSYSQFLAIPSLLLLLPSLFVFFSLGGGKYTGLGLFVVFLSYFIYKTDISQASSEPTDKKECIEMLKKIPENKKSIYNKMFYFQMIYTVLSVFIATYLTEK